jgi:hypothetical protein
MQTTGILITASLAALLSVSPVTADEHHYGSGGGGNGWRQWHGGGRHEHHGGECGWSCCLDLSTLALGGVLAALYSAPPPVYFPLPVYVQPRAHDASPPAFYPPPGYPPGYYYSPR